MCTEAAGMAVPELCEMLDRAAVAIDALGECNDDLAREWHYEWLSATPTPDAWTPTAWKLRMDGGATIDVFADGGWAVYTANCGRIMATGHHDTVDAAKAAAVESWRRVTGRET
jgi:hypothetical protein